MTTGSDERYDYRGLMTDMTTGTDARYDYRGLK